MLEIILNKHRSYESNPHNKSITCIIITVKLFPKSKSPKDFQVEISLKFSICLPPTPKSYIVLNVENNRKEGNEEKNNTI